MSEATALRCRACRAPIPAEARYCPACGAASSRHRKELARRDAARSRRQNRAGLALAWIACGTVAGGLGLAFVVETEAMGLAVHAGWLVVAALVGAGLMGWRPVASWLPMGWAHRFWWLAPVVGLGCAAVAFAYVGAMMALFVPDASDPLEVDGLGIVAALVVAPLLEELLCRGVAWEAARRLAGERGAGADGEGAAWTVSSIIFAAIHGLNGGFWLEIPHRLLGGFALGWLRRESGGLAAPVLAHFCWNAAAVALP